MILSFLVLLMSSMWSCNNDHSILTDDNAPYHFGDFQSVKAIMNDDSEKALSLLQKLDEDGKVQEMSDFDRNEYYLLLIQVQFKNHCLTTESYDLLPVAAFYDSLVTLYPEDKNLLLLKAMSHYYCGTEAGMASEDVEAMTDYLDALRVMDVSFQSNKSTTVVRFKALVNTRIGELLYYYDIMGPALTVYQNAYTYFDKVDDTAGMAAMTRNIGLIYQANKDYDKALDKFKEANEIQSVGDDIYLHSQGGQFLMNQQYDSAIVYFEKAYEVGDLRSSADAAAELAELYHQQGDTGKENYYTRIYVTNALKVANRASTKMEIDYLYSEYQTEYKKMEAEKPNRNLGLFIFIASIVLVFSVLIYVIIRNRHKILHIEKQITVIEAKRHEESKEGDNLNESALRQMPDTIVEKVEAPHVSEFDACWDKFTSSNIYLKINGMVSDKDIMTKSVTLYPKLKLNESDLIELVRTTNFCFPDFSARLLQHYTELSSSDLRHCCLALSGMNDAEIAVLEGISYSGANRKTNRIIGAMHTTDTIEQTLLVFLKNNW